MVKITPQAHSDRVVWYLQHLVSLYIMGLRSEDAVRYMISAACLGTANMHSHMAVAATFYNK